MIFGFRKLILLGIAAAAVLQSGPEVATAQDVSAGVVFTDMSEGNWNISVAYPHFNAYSLTADIANSDGVSMARREYDAFLAEARKEVPELRSYGSSAMYFLSVSPLISLDLPELCSGYVEREAATGGANAQRSFSVMNYASDGESVRALRLADLFYDGSDGIEACSRAAVSEFMAQDNPPSNVASGSWTGLSAEQAQRFVIAPGGLIFLFGKGELGSGAEGTTSVLCPWQSLDGLDYEGYLKPLFDRQARYNRDILTGRQWALWEIRFNDDRTLQAATNADGSMAVTSWVQFNSDNSVSGKAGINSFSGRYSASDSGSIEIGNLAMTKALNPPGIDAEFERFFPSSVTWHIENAMLFIDLPLDSGTMAFMMSGIDGAL